MAKHVGRHGLYNAGDLPVSRKWPPNVWLLQPILASARNEQRDVRIGSRLQIYLQPVDRAARKEDDPFLITLAHDLGLPGFQIDLVPVKRQQFADTHRTAEECLD